MAVKLDPPYDGYAVWHQHHEKKHGRLSFDAIEDRLGRCFVWDADRQIVVKLCRDRTEAINEARKRAQQ